MTGPPPRHALPSPYVTWPCTQQKLMPKCTMQREPTPASAPFIISSMQHVAKNVRRRCEGLLCLLLLFMGSLAARPALNARAMQCVACV